MRTTSNNDKKQMVWTKERITFCRHCPVLQKSIILSEDLKLSMAKNAQKVHRFAWWDALQGGLRSPPNIGTSYFSNWNIVFSCWREGCIWSEAFPMKLIAKLAFFCPLRVYSRGKYWRSDIPATSPGRRTRCHLLLFQIPPGQILSKENTNQNIADQYVC